ncbi:hypothetical protein ACN38_g677 [Penicillium nordicum]|uniref:Uncharacterized protein n=1 Tax=Penicillium nordicum TaxID=229535 RepID=A0A0M8PA81_9EURO|nr:hypothetical protein ACN38_g677 [Penicillium nordicum]
MKKWTRVESKPGGRIFISWWLVEQWDIETNTPPSSSSLVQDSDHEPQQNHGTVRVSYPKITQPRGSVLRFCIFKVLDLRVEQPNRSLNPPRAPWSPVFRGKDCRFFLTANDQ